jgi:TetR/AcrR family transcriptional repressor of nem operon
MGRVSREAAAGNREAAIDAAARLFRERGLDSVSVPEVMGAVGLTHGGFYRQFDSKADLAAQGCTRAFDELLGLLGEIESRHPGNPLAAEDEFVATYLSPAHRDDSGAGCPTAALAGDVAREDAKSPIRAAYIAGVRRMAKALERLEGKKGSAGSKSDSKAEALTRLSALVGAIVLARATRGDPLSGQILKAASDSVRNR